MLFSIIAGIVIIFLLVVLDIYFAVDNIKDNTWSEMIRSAGKHTALIPWVCGVLSGHFFHWDNVVRAPFGHNGNIVMLVWLTVVIATLHLYFNFHYGYLIPMWLIFFVAFFVGSFFWPV